MDKPDTRHLDNTLRIFRSVRKVASTVPSDDIEALTKGLLALGWTQDCMFVSTRGSRIRIIGHTLWRAGPGSTAFRPLPPKAIRNILLAGQ